MVHEGGQEISLRGMPFRLTPARRLATKKHDGNKHDGNSNPLSLSWGPYVSIYIDDLASMLRSSEDIIFVNTIRNLCFSLHTDKAQVAPSPSTPGNDAKC